MQSATQLCGNTTDVKRILVVTDSYTLSRQIRTLIECAPVGHIITVRASKHYITGYTVTHAIMDELNVE
jgi:hypothetical protein